MAKANELLSELPSFNKQNFTKYNTDGSYNRCKAIKPAVYLQLTNDHQGTPQVITTDKTNILLRYLRQQIDVRENLSLKRENNSHSPSGPSRKQARTEQGQE